MLLCWPACVLGVPFPLLKQVTSEADRATLTSIHAKLEHDRERKGSGHSPNLAPETDRPEQIKKQDFSGIPAEASASKV